MIHAAMDNLPAKTKHLRLMVKSVRKILLYTKHQYVIRNTCDSNTHLLYKGKCTPKTDLGCCFNNFGLAQFGYSCDMKTGKNCTLTTKDECTGYPLPTWAVLGSIASTTGIPGIPKFSTTCSLDLSINYSPD